MNELERKYSTDRLPGSWSPHSTNEHLSHQTVQPINLNRSRSPLTTTANKENLNAVEQITNKQRASVTNFGSEPNLPQRRMRDREMANRSVSVVSLDDKGFSRSTNLSAMYGVIVVLVGFVIPMAEALTKNWMSSHFVAVFMAYLYGVASVFIIYVHTHEFVLRRKFEKEQHTFTDEVASNASNEHYQPKDDQAITVQIEGNNNLGYIKEEKEQEMEQNDEPVASSSVKGSEDDDSSFASSEEPENPDLRRRTFDADHTSTSPVRRGNTLLRQRFSTIPSEIKEHSPDDVYNYIASHVGTATMANEGTSYFLKAGSLIFAMANMVYVALRIQGEHQCGGDRTIYPHYLHLVFILLQTFFLLKDTEFVLRKYKVLIRFGLSHLVATNLCVWLRFLMLEVVEAIVHQTGLHGDTHGLVKDNVTDNSSCDADTLIYTASPYLFPFVLEYSLVAMSVAAFTFSSINIRVSKELYKAVSKFLRNKGSMESFSYSSVSTDSTSQQEGRFSKSHTGLFSGIILLAGCIVSMILFFFWIGEGLIRKADLNYTITETVLHVLMTVAVIMGMVKFFKFEVDINHSNTLDHLLLLVSVAFYVILNIFKLLSTVTVIMDEENDDPLVVMMLVVIIVSLIQSILQTVFIIDGMQRVAVKHHEQRNKHGRNIVTFLIVTNVTAWVFNSFQEKRAASNLELEYYGEVAWSIINSVALPMILFYRFHSSICLAHMWHHCYEKHEENIMDNQILQ